MFRMLQVCVLSLLFTCSWAFQCHHGAHLQFAENIIDDKEQVVECSANVKFCKRIFGTLNGQDGWIASCVYSGSEAEKNCKATGSQSDCKQVSKSGEGALGSTYTECCCATENCNDATLKPGGGTDTPTTAATTTTTKSASSSVASLGVMCLALLVLKLRLRHAVIGGVNGLQCYSGSLESQNTEYAFTSLSSKQCDAAVSFCTSTYLNDGWGITITMDCDVGNKCKEGVSQSIDTTNAKRYCCKGDLCNGKSITEKVQFQFPDSTKFFFSSATSAYQVEGAAFEDGKGPSSWDTYVRKPGKIKDNSTGDEACDTYHKYKEDIQLMKSMGLDQYRFSVSWPRVLPTGTLPANQLGVTYYNNLINELIANGITPVMTLMHWDMPQALMDKGGFLNPNIVEWFRDYADFCFGAFGDRVQWWLTLNEPLSMAQFEYCGNTHADAPGEFIEHCEWSMYLAAHHMILAHAAASNVYRTKYAATQKGKIGIALCGANFLPETNSADDVEAARSATEFSYGWFGNPIFNASHDYPQVMKDRISKRSNDSKRVVSRLPEFTDAQKQMLSGSADFIGLNYYTTSLARNRKPEEYEPNSIADMAVEHLDGGFVPSNDPKWRQIGGSNGWIYNTPFGLRELFNFFRDHYGNPPVLMTENGCMDSPGEDMHDVSRINYLRSQLMAISEAIKDNCNIIGHTLWSLLDNFEWIDGYHTKFGAYRVDFSSSSKTRTPKDSVAFYKDVIAKRGVESL